MPSVCGCFLCGDGYHVKDGNGRGGAQRGKIGMGGMTKKNQKIRAAPNKGGGIAAQRFLRISIPR